MAGIVKMDDAGLWLSRKSSALAQVVADSCWARAAADEAALVLGTAAAMFLVGGGILVRMASGRCNLTSVGAPGIRPQRLGAVLAENTANALVGVIAGALRWPAWRWLQKLRGR